jgi:hypothetical protein
MIRAVRRGSMGLVSRWRAVFVKHRQVEHRQEF